MTKKRHFQSFFQAVKNGKADPRIISLCTFLNQQSDYFTASSCSGRIVVMELNQQENKRESAFAYKKHGPVQAKTIWSMLQTPTPYTYWFKQEPFILHLGTHSLTNANRILSWCRNTGIKRAGIIVTKPGRWIIEAIGTQGMAIPVKEKNQILITKPYLRQVVKQANKKLRLNFKRLQLLEDHIRKDLETEKL